MTSKTNDLRRLREPGEAASLAGLEWPEWPGRGYLNPDVNSSRA
jgi:hypothetical protein